MKKTNFVRDLGLATITLYDLGLTIEYPEAKQIIKNILKDKFMYTDEEIENNFRLPYNVFLN